MPRRPGRAFVLRRVVLALAWAVRVEYLVRHRPLAEVCAQVEVALAAPQHSNRASMAGDDVEPALLSLHDLACVRAVDHVFARWPVRGYCLRRALVLGRLLRYREPQLMIGVRQAPSGPVEAHAWLTIDGGTLDRTAGTYVALASAPAE